jgi:hypothetical protein
MIGYKLNTCHRHGVRGQLCHSWTEPLILESGAKEFDKNKPKQVIVKYSVCSFATRKLVAVGRV